uniref:Uncharacterized protein n=1 Tax=Setaria viridis TaxID=4556 RepID=A0A4U6VN39_SETVI|nr:hypothetical protein SEVIR_2G085950v2 [Setaria viridis]
MHERRGSTRNVEGVLVEAVSTRKVTYDARSPFGFPQHPI